MPGFPMYLCKELKIEFFLWKYVLFFQSQMDLSNEADIKGSPETKSNEDSGVEVQILINKD